MTSLALYAAAGAVLLVLGLHSALVRAHLVWKVLAINVMSTGIFLLLVAAPPRLDPERADPVPQAMVLTGIVVAVAATALALAIALRVAARTGEPYLAPVDRAPAEDEGKAGAGRDDGGSREPRENADGADG